MISSLLVSLYRVVHGKFHLPGAGWLLRRLRPVLPGLRAYPLKVPGVGTAIVDFQDIASFGLLNFSMGELGQNQQLFHYLEEAIQPGDVLWDVGSNLGFIPIYFADARHRLSAIHAFEPNPVALKPLQSLFQGHPRVRVHPVGLGDTDGEFTMNVVPDGSLISSLVRPLDNSRPVRVQIRRGDAFQQEHGLESPQVMKIDVEGFEPQVFAGLSQIIQSKRPIIFFEHTFLTGAQIQSLQPKHYSIRYILDQGGLAPHPSAMGPSHDAIFIPDEKKKFFALS